MPLSFPACDALINHHDGGKKWPEKKSSIRAIRVLKAEEESREVKVVVAEEGGLKFGIVTKKSPGAGAVSKVA